MVLSLVFFAICGTANAQYLEQVHLKNGSIIRGTVIEQVPGQSIKIQSIDGNIFVYSYDDVAKITKEVYGNRDRIFNTEQKIPKDYRTPRYEGGFEVGYAVGTNGFGDGAGVVTTHGCLINPYLYVGVGGGFHYYLRAARLNSYEALKGNFSVPIFADCRTYFHKGHFKPFLNIRIGYDVTLSGLYVNPALGIRYDLLDFSAGFMGHFSVVDRDRDLFTRTYKRKLICNIILKVGVRF